MNNFKLHNYKIVLNYFNILIKSIKMYDKQELNRFIILQFNFNKNTNLFQSKILTKSGKINI